MSFSTTILAVVIQLLAVALPKIGVNIGTEELTQTVSTLAVIGAGLWIWIQRAKKGDITPLGKRL
jgi:uncharacterized metal-binding protein